MFIHASPGMEYGCLYADNVKINFHMLWKGHGYYMFNIYSKKTKRIISVIIIAFLVLAMVIPTLAYLI